MAAHPGYRDRVPVRRVAPWWHLLTLLVAGGALVIQLFLVLRGDNVLIDDQGVAAVGTAERVLRFFSYFTVESNIIVAACAAVLISDPDRDGAVFRAGRLAGLIGITVTGVVLFLVLRPLLDLHGISAVTDFLFHVAAPVLAVVGFLLFGPWPPFSWRVVLWSLVWPIAWVGWTFAHGGWSDWYPYPFLDVGDLGYAVALRNVVLVAVGAIALGALFGWLGDVLGRGGRGQSTSSSSPRSAS